MAHLGLSAECACVRHFACALRADGAAATSCGCAPSKRIPYLLQHSHHLQLPTFLRAAADWDGTTTALVSLGMFTPYAVM